MEAEETTTGSFVPPWALGMLVPWAGLAIYRIISTTDGMVFQVITGSLMAVILVGVGVPYLVYRITGRSQKPAVITIGVIGALGLVAQSTLLMRGSPIAFKESPELRAYVNAILTDPDAARGDVSGVLLAKMKDAEAGLEGDELLLAKAYHATMQTQWVLRATQQRQIRELQERGVFSALKAQESFTVVQVNRNKNPLKQIAQFGETIRDQIASEHRRIMKTVVKAGGSERKAQQIADQICRDTASEERLAVAEASAKVWGLYRDICNPGFVRDSSGNVRRVDDVRKELRAELTKAEEELKAAAARLEAKIKP